MELEGMIDGNMDGVMVIVFFFDARASQPVLPVIHWKRRLVLHDRASDRRDGHVSARYVILLYSVLYDRAITRCHSGIVWQQSKSVGLAWK